MPRLVIAVAALVASGLVVGCGGGGTPSELGIPPKLCSTEAVPVTSGEEMEPGGDCVGCHAKGGAPALMIGGTVMAALHDDTNCRGVAGATVRITGSDGQKIELTTNAVGNFFVLAGAGAPTLKTPFSAEVELGGKVQKMLTAQSNTNCMACHTAPGAMLAIGRIVPPAP
jgi:mono/diheme cytochrome c family protein